MRAARTQLQDRVEFVCADVFDAADLAGTDFDGVYTSWGVVCWLPDLDKWAVVRRLVRTGEWFYLAEFHPYATASPLGRVLI